MSKWKKYADDEYYLENDKYSFAKMWKIGLSSKERKRRGIGAYAVSTRIGLNGNEFKRYFKTKKKANEDLKNYLRGYLK